MYAQELFLFDIDGTLLDVGGAGRQSFAAGLHQTFGLVDVLGDITFAGATDLGILHRLAARHPALAADRHDEFFAAMARSLERFLSSGPPALLPGVAACLARLRAREGVVLGLVTGNARRCAEIKVRAAGLAPEWFVVGGFGDEHADRDVLAARALEAARRRFGDFSQVSLIGDTPADIRAAHHIGARAIAVATGPHDAAALFAAGAHEVWQTFDDAPLRAEPVP